ncbi:High mobility group protein 20A [Phytophthora ramorum]
MTASSHDKAREEPVKKSMAPVKRPLSSYMHFCNERRRQVMDENPGVRIGQIQKVISAQWKALTPEQKEVYVQIAAKDKARYEQELLDNPQVNDEPSVEQKDSNACIYPLGRVRKMVQSDPDVGKVSRDALLAISKASELFAQFLGTKSYEQALYRNKRQLKASDVTRTIQTTASLDWLREDFPDVRPSRADAPAAKKDQEKDKRTLPDSASFFKPRAAEEANE